MKRLFIFMLFAQVTLTLFSQTGTDKPQQLKLKKGIYYSFLQITTDNPAGNDSFWIKERTNNNIFLFGGGKYSFELGSKDKAEFRKIKKECVGISDGENFYISDRFTVGGWQGMTCCLLSGPYIIAPIQGNAGQYTGGGLIPSTIKVGNGFLIDLNKGTSSKLSNKTLKELLIKYPDISKEYQGKNDLMEFAAEIINAVNIILQR